MNSLNRPKSRTWFERFGYRFCLDTARMATLLSWQVRCYGQEHYPTEGGALLCSNHQSHLDPILVGISCRRRMNFLARKSLYKFKPFGALISFLDAIPLDREGIGVAGIKETIRRCRQGELVLIFPEGARSFDGEVGAILPGVVALAQRTRVPLVPIGIAGAYQAWPRQRALPRPGLAVVQAGAAIPPSDYSAMSEEQLLQVLGTRIRDCFAEARARRERLLAG